MCLLQLRVHRQLQQNHGGEISSQPCGAIQEERGSGWGTIISLSAPLKDRRASSSAAGRACTRSLPVEELDEKPDRTLPTTPMTMPNPH